MGTATINPCIFVFVQYVSDSNFIEGRVAHILAVFVVVWDQIHFCNVQDCCT